MISFLPELSKHKFICVVATSFLIAGSFPASGNAAKTATEEWNISADKIIHYEKPKSIIAEGNIVLEKREALPPPRQTKTGTSSDWSDLLGEEKKPKPPTADEISKTSDEKPPMKVTTTITADWIAYDVEQQSIRAKGHVKIVSGTETLMASEGNVDLNTQNGSFDDAVLIRKEKQLHLEGKKLSKTGYNTYYIEKGWVVTCKLENGETPPWSIASSDTSIEKGGYAVMHHARFNVYGVPIFYTPYMILPVKDTRQSGFLAPEFSYSENSGFGFNLPYFININDSVDATIFPQYYTNRGFMPGAELRYVRDAQNKGAFIANYLNDQLSDPSETEYYKDTGFTHTNQDRYWVQGKADGSLGEDWLVRLDVDIASDRDYLTEFKSGYAGYDAAEARYLTNFGRGFDSSTSVYRDNTLSAMKYWNGMSVTTSLVAVNDLYEDERAPGNPTPLWQLPDVRFDGVMPFYQSNVTFNWDTQYVDYWREEGIGANRFDLHPSISTPIPVSQYLETRAEVGARETFYSISEYGDTVWGKDDTQNRFLADFELEIATTLLKELDKYADNTALEHQIRPFVRYNYIPDVDQDDIPHFDSVDRIGEASKITYGLDNFLNKTYPTLPAFETAEIRLFQSYSLLDKDTETPFSDFGGIFQWTPQAGTRFRYITYFDVYENVFSSHTIEGRYTTPRGDFAEVDYSFYDTTTSDLKKITSLKSYFDTEDIELVNAKIRKHLFERWLAQAAVQYSLSSDKTIESKFSVIYQAPCWSIEVQSLSTLADNQVMLIFNLANLHSPLRMGF